MSLLFPLAVPAAYKAAPGDGELFKLTISAILAGAVFGDHWQVPTCGTPSSAPSLLLLLGGIADAVMLFSAARPACDVAEFKCATKCTQTGMQPCQRD